MAKKTPRPFKAIGMVDPKTGKKVSGDQMIETPGGKKVSAKVYFAALNDFENSVARVNAPMSYAAWVSRRLRSPRKSAP